MVVLRLRIPLLYQQDKSIFALLGHIPVTLGVQMATVRKRSTSKGTKYQAQIRKKGHQPISKLFATYKDARTFAKETESKIERSVFQSGENAEAVLFGDMAERFLREARVPYR
ncbi:MAG: hypothetical protein GY875_03495 [Gammaproteobacteria bacterium]|nr:hypothetical protein [Gammaproteobacteria bacterium]